MSYTSKNSVNEYDENAISDLPKIRNAGKKSVQTEHVRRKLKQNAVTPEEQRLSQEALHEKSYHFTYQASQHESQWLLDSLNEIYFQKWFEDILKMVKGGKEASVYLCTAPANMPQLLLAAKVYRPRRFRNLKKDHIYREGRDQLDATGKIILDDRAHHAMKKKTNYGLSLLHSSWVGHEFRTMQILADAGADIPRPYVSSDNAILMDYIGDEDSAAPTLNTVSLSVSEARVLFERVIFNIRLMLQFNRVHADLSAYNILYWDGEIRIIDFPQAVNPEENHNSYTIFHRDVQRICEYFSSMGVKNDPDRLAGQMWTERGRRTNPLLDPAYLDAENEEDRLVWQKQKE